MKLVIDIHEETYQKFLIHGLSLCPRDKDELINAIDNGIVLPKGCGRLINADAFIEQEACCGYIDCMDVDTFNERTPTIIAAAG